MVKDEILNELYFYKALGYRFIGGDAGRRGTSAPNLAALGAQISRCNLCPLAKTRQKIVRGAFCGSAPAPNPKVLVVAPNPSSANGWLNETLKILANIGVSANEVYLTHLIKCDSNLNYKNGVNGENLTFCAAQCKEYLLDEIALLTPKIVLALGAKVFAELCGETDCSFASLRGGVFRSKSALVAPTHDPALIASNPSLAAQFAQDVAKLKGYL